MALSEKLTARGSNDNSSMGLAEDAVCAEQVVEDDIFSVSIQTTKDVIKDYHLFSSVDSSCKTLEYCQHATNGGG